MVRDVLVTLGGESHALRFRLQAWASLEDHGYRLDEIITELQQTGGKLSLKAFQVLLWAMLQHESPKPSLEQVGEWVDGENFSDITAKIAEALKGAFPLSSAVPESLGTGTVPVS